MLSRKFWVSVVLGPIGALCAYAGAQAACLPIKDVVLKNVTIFEPADIDNVVAPFEGKCLGIADIEKVLEAVTSAYVDAGYITTRAYLPEQNLADGSLEIEVVEGTIESITFNGEDNPMWQAVTFPGMVGNYANLRDIEQGLDNIRSMRTYVAQMELEPGEEAGTSILNVDATTSEPWEFSYATNNYGSDATGKYLSTVGFAYDNALGINDKWQGTLTKSMSPWPISWDWDGPSTTTASINLTLPIGYWEHSASWSDTVTTNPVASQVSENLISSENLTTTLNWTSKRLMHRDQDTKTFLTFSLNRTDKRDKILTQGTEVEIGSSGVITSAKLHLAHQLPLLGGHLSLGAGVDKGLRLFGAEDYGVKSAEDPNAPNAQFTRFLVDAGFGRYWNTELGAIKLSSNFSAQYSPDILHDTQIFSLGGPSSLRGVWGGLASGSTGALLRNELSWDITTAQSAAIQGLSIYGAVDLGVIARENGRDQASNSLTENEFLSGAAIGFRVRDETLDVDFAYANLTSLFGPGSRDPEGYPGIFMISLGSRF